MNGPGIDLHGQYADPVRMLLRIGQPPLSLTREWPDLAGEFGIGHEHVSSLIEMACDPLLNGSDTIGAEVWAPLHAWRTLGQLRAAAAVAPLLGLLGTMEDDVVAPDELPVVFGMIGAPAIPAIEAFLADPATTTWPATTALLGLVEIALRRPLCRPACVSSLVGLLNPGAGIDDIVRGYAVSALLDLDAVEAIDAIRAALQRDAIDISVAGDLEDVEIAFGLRKKRTTPAPRYVETEHPWYAPPSDDDFDRVVPVTPSSEKIGRNEPCPCGSGKKYKKCCLS